MAGERPTGSGTSKLVSILEECRSLLVVFRDAAETEFRKTEESLAKDHWVRVPFLVLRHALAFAEPVLGALILTAPRYPECAALLCRPLFELSCRILWGFSRPNGLQSLWYEWSKSDQTWAKEAIMLGEELGWEDLKRFAETILQGRNPVPAHYKQAPPFDQILKELPSLSTLPLFAKLQYTQVYRIMCRKTHGSLSMIHLTPEAEFTLAAIAAVHSVYYLLQALVRTIVSSGVDKALDELAGEFLKLQKKIEDVQLFFM